MKEGSKKKLIYLCIIIQLIAIIGIQSVGAQPTNPLIVYGKVYDKHNNAMGNIQVTLKNVDTGETQVNSTPVTAADGYQFNLGNFNSGWSKGDVLRINSSYEEGGHTYIESYEFPIPYTINETGYILNRPLHLDNCIDCEGNDDIPNDVEKPDHYYITGTIYKQNGEPASGALVIVKNMRTGDRDATTTEQNGTYAHDLIFLDDGWEYKDNIRINATYGTGENYQIGFYDFKILYSLKNRRVVNVQMYKSFKPEVEEPDEPDEKTVEEWRTAYYTLWGQYNDSLDEIEVLQQEIDDLKNESTNTTKANHTQEEWDKLQWEVQRLERTVNDNNTIIILLAIVSILCIGYILWRNDLIPLPIIGRHSDR
jgi:FtsZ-binding cell division protein ZapB